MGQFRRLKQKLTPKKDTPRRLQNKKNGSDFLLTAMFFLTIFIMILGWERFETLNRALYVFLTLSLGIIYANRHMKMTDRTRGIVEKVGWAAIGIATVLFVVLFYQQYIA